jgi:hypothetical protein
MATGYHSGRILSAGSTVLTYNGFLSGARVLKHLAFECQQNFERAPSQPFNHSPCIN